MSIQYDQYLVEHRDNVRKSIDWISHNLPDIMSIHDYYYNQIGWYHDYSKDTAEEYDAYDQYFYGSRKTKDVEDNFNKAWLHHIHNNPHHWQHWVLINDDPSKGTVALIMPHRYVVEMICDWWSFSWANGNLYEIFDWYDSNKTHIQLHDITRDLVEEILGRMKSKLDELNEDNQEDKI